MASTDRDRWKPMTDTDRRELEPDSTTAREAPVVLAEFRSVLFRADEGDLRGAEEPAFFSDLNLDQVVEAVVGGRVEYELKSFFYALLRDVDAVEYRHEVFREFETGIGRSAMRPTALRD
jgi:hypothetical protein